MYSKTILWDFFILGNTILETGELHFQDINKAHIYKLTVTLLGSKDCSKLSTCHTHTALTEMWELETARILSFSVAQSNKPLCCD